MEHDEFSRILAAQDEQVRAAGVDIWVGMEPTFTRRFAETPEWLSEALGPDKLGYARQLLQEVCRRQPGGLVLHTLGRQYAGEDGPRWSMGYYQGRRREVDWRGPPDPLLLPAADSADDEPAIDVEAFWRGLNAAVNASGRASSAFFVEGDLRYRLLFRCDDTAPAVDVKARPQLARPSVHGQKIPLEGLTDELAQSGDYLLCLDALPAGEERAHLLLELPAVPDVDNFLQLMQMISAVAAEASIPSLRMQGFPPPVDDTVAWTTITPDPAVIEINQAPDPDAASFYTRSDLFYTAARSLGLWPYRLHYNGVVSDSGGGGQFTLGGADPEGSPFLRYPQLLPRLIRYLVAHPALSYWLSPPAIGSTSQSPRADEGLRESFYELTVALEQLDRIEAPSAEIIWRSLSPFLVDPSGNPHRSELNIEKLWNPYLPGRGCLGLVEFRAFRMSRSAECAAAIIALLRGIVAMLCREDTVSSLTDHGAALHDKYALPFFLQRDLQAVFADLARSGLPLHDSLQALLLQEPVRFIGQAEFQGCTIELRQALEFWPLVGDAASQEGGGSRLMDASTTRLQVLISAADPGQLDDWELCLDGYRVPLQTVDDGGDAVRLTGIRYRNFQPLIGLHPGIPARDHLTLSLCRRDLDEALDITFYEWQPQGLPYTGLPEDMADADRRRQERFVSQVVSLRDRAEPPQQPPAAALTTYCFDLRRLP